MKHRETPDSESTKRRRRRAPASDGAGGNGEFGPQTALVVKAIRREERDLEDPFEEITALCETAGAVVAGKIGQNLDRVHAATYLGRGKIDEIAATLAELDVDLVVTDNDLSPAQERNLEKIFKRTVVDRSQLILDIFAHRASTLQAKIQVELAQLKYTFPRLKRMWDHLSRYEGGIGMRGPGETQLETDKRLIQRRIQSLQRKLDRIENRTELALRQHRKDFVVALVGYTNVGKSTLLNRLTGARELVEDKLFATLDTRTRKWPLDRNRHVLLNDTVGFIERIPHHLVASFHATLAETRHADLLFHVVDAGAVNSRRQFRAARDVLGEIECGDKPTWLILNKWDRVDNDGLVEARNLETLAPPETPVFRVSAVTGVGLEELRSAVAERLDSRNRRVSLVLPHQRGELLAYIRQNGKVLEQEFHEDGVHVEAELSPAPLEKLHALYPEGFPESDGED